MGIVSHREISPFLKELMLDEINQMLDGNKYPHDEDLLKTARHLLLSGKFHLVNELVNPELYDFCETLFRITKDYAYKPADNINMRIYTGP